MRFTKAEVAEIGRVGADSARAAVRLCSVCVADEGQGYVAEAICRVSRGDVFLRVCLGHALVVVRQELRAGRFPAILALMVEGKGSS